MDDFSEIRDDRDAIDAAVIEASGRACEGLGRAIAGMGGSSPAAEVQELVTQLKYMSKSLGWILRDVNGRRTPAVEPASRNGHAPASRKGH